MATAPEYPCTACGAPCHPATGDFDRELGVQFCHPCVEYRKKWHLGQLNRGVAGDGDRESGVPNFYQAATTSIRPGMNEPTVFQKFVRTANPKDPDKQHKRNGRWRAGPDGVKVPMGPRAWRSHVWRAKS